MALFKSDKVSAVKEQVFCALGDEGVLLQLQTGTYYGLNAVGRRIWELLAQPRTVEEICAAILEEFEVEPARCENDVIAILQQLQAAQLIQVHAAGTT